MRASTRLRAVSNIAKHEGRVCQMYLDSVGVVTVGVGHAIFTVEDACCLGFMRGNRAATRAEIIADYTGVKYTKRKGTLFLPVEEMDRILAFDMGKFEHIVEAAFPEVDSYPESVQVALIDIAFNCGSFKGWPSLAKAVKAGDWVTAAKESKRKPPVGDERNRDTQEQFTEHLQEEKAA